MAIYAPPPLQYWGQEGQSHDRKDILKVTNQPKLLAELRQKIKLSAVYKKLAFGTECVDTTQKIEGLPIGSSSFLTFSHSCCLRSRISSSSTSETNETPLILQLCNPAPRVFHLALFALPGLGRGDERPWERGWQL